jgi:SAM-dependent methyltransferase
MANLDYVAIDLTSRLYADVRGDLTAAPFRADAFDAVLCVHVLEEIPDDRRALRELARVLKPGAWAVISVPIRLDRPTFEDPNVTTPQERERAFGEPAHVRVYGSDLRDRIEACGFRVQIDLGTSIPSGDRLRYGLRDDENVFYCTKV